MERSVSWSFLIFSAVKWGQYPAGKKQEEGVFCYLMMPRRAKTPWMCLTMKDKTIFKRTFIAFLRHSRTKTERGEITSSVPSHFLSPSTPTRDCQSTKLQGPQSLSASPPGAGQLAAAETSGGTSLQDSPLLVGLWRTFTGQAQQVTHLSPPQSPGLVWPLCWCWCVTHRWDYGRH